MLLWNPLPRTPAEAHRWRPLELACLAAATHPFLPIIVPAEFCYLELVERAARPDIHVYRHRQTRRPLLLDQSLQAYVHQPPRAPTSTGRYVRARDFEWAIRQLDLHARPAYLFHAADETVRPNELGPVDLEWLVARPLFADAHQEPRNQSSPTSDSPSTTRPARTSSRTRSRGTQSTRSASPQSVGSPTRSAPAALKIVKV